MKYRPEIDGLRAVAIVPVVLFHAGLGLFSGGFVGVDVFFVISGYLITSLIIEDLKSSSFSILEFYERRARRILPALFFVAACCIPFALVLMSPAQYVDFSESLVSVAAFVSNLHFLLETDYFAEAAETRPLLHTWSLAIEEQFYLFYPAFLLLFWKFGMRTIIVALAILSLLSLSLAQLGGNLKLSPPYVEPDLLLFDVPVYAFFLLPTRGWELAAGALAALYLAERKTDAGSSVFHTLASVLGAAFILLAIFWFDRDTPFPSIYTVLPVLGTVLIILFGFPGTLVGKVLSVPVVVGTGLISYSVYLWHQPLFAFARHLFPEGLSAPVIFLLAAGSVVAGYLSWRFIERPFRNRENFSRAGIFWMSGVSAAALICIGIAGVATKGFLFRIPPTDRELAQIDPVKEGHETVVAFNRVHHAPFDGEARTKVLLIGDSYAVDVMNALLAGGLAPGVSFSTHSIASSCVDVFADEHLRNSMDEATRSLCARNGWEAPDLVQKRMSEADIVMLSFNWKPKQVSRLPDVISRIESLSGANLIVVGTKSFGGLSAARLLDVEARERAGVRGELGKAGVAVNAQLAELADPGRYVDFMQLVCGEKGSCPLYTQDGQLLSYDGYHVRLTAAPYVGRKLLEAPPLARLRE